MKSLEERKKQRAEQRAIQQKESGIEGQSVISEFVNSNGKAYSEMTIAELKKAAQDMGTEVPKDKTKLEEIREFVENLAKFKSQQGDQTDGAGGWKSGN